MDFRGPERPNQLVAKEASPTQPVTASRLRLYPHGHIHGPEKGLPVPCPSLDVPPTDDFAKVRTLGPCGFQTPFPADRASASSSLLRRSSSVGSRFSSLSFAQPFLRSSDARSTPLISAVPMSRGTSSLGGKECVDVNVIGFPTARARRNSRDSNAQSLDVRVQYTRVGEQRSGEPRGRGVEHGSTTHFILARRGAHARCLNIREVQDAEGRASEPRAHDRVRRTHEHVPLLRDLALRPRGSAQDERVAGDHGWLLDDVQDTGHEW